MVHCVGDEVLDRKGGRDAVVEEGISEADWCIVKGPAGGVSGIMGD